VIYYGTNVVDAQAMRQSLPPDYVSYMGVMHADEIENPKRAAFQLQVRKVAPQVASDHRSTPSKKRDIYDSHLMILFQRAHGPRSSGDSLHRSSLFRNSAFPVVRESLGRIPPDPLFDRGSSYFVGTANCSATNPRRIQIAVPIRLSNPGPLKSRYR
jgi:hypothetical protein